MVTHQLFQAALTEQQYYWAIIDDEHAAMAFTTMETLCKGQHSRILLYNVLLVFIANLLLQ